MKKILLDGAWEGQRCSNGSVFPATVPGCVHTDLMKLGQLPGDIYWRDTAQQVQWIEKEDWAYTRRFTVDALEEGAALVFECLDTYAEVYLNESHVGSAENMFITHRFPVDGTLRQGENTLRVVFRSPVQKTKDAPARPAAFSKDRLYTRRLQCTYGWDWTMRFVTCGIEKSCYLVFDNCPRAAHTYLYTEQVDEFGAQLVCDTQFVNYEKGLTYTITLEDPRGNTVYTNTRYCEESWHREYITVADPQLWYPVGYGAQPLYTLKITCGQEVLHHTVGIRTVKVLQITDQPGTEAYELCRRLQASDSGREWDHNESYSCFIPVVNGKRIFCKGADWVPCEPFISEVTEEKVTRILELAARMGLNMIRVWGGGMFETEHFYSQCDRLGIMVTQDFLMACGDYPEEESWFFQALQAEAEFAAIALRNHPSLLWWSGDNENAVAGNERMKEYMGRTAAMKAIGPVLKALDPARIFLPSSPYGGDPYASKTVGTTHNTQFLGSFFGYLEKEDLSDYKDEYKNYLARFIAEEPSMGAVSINSLRRMMDERDIYETEDMWLYHTQSNPALQRELFEYEKLFAEKVLGSFRDGEDRLFKLQYIQYEWVRLSFELARRNLWFNSGLLYWMLADCWPAASGWALIDYYGMPKASYYSFRRCAKAVVGSIDRENGGYCAYITNDGVTGQSLAVSIKKLNYQSGKITRCVEQQVQVEAQSIARICVDCALSQNEILVCDLQNGDIQDRCFYKEGDLELIKTEALQVTEKTETSVTVEATGYVHAVALEGDCVFDDSYFSLLPGERRTVSFTLMEGKEPEITCAGYTLPQRA